MQKSILIECVGDSVEKYVTLYAFNIQSCCNMLTLNHELIEG